MENKIFLMLFAVFILSIFSSEIVFMDDILSHEDFNNQARERGFGLEIILAMEIIRAGGEEICVY